MRGRLRCAREGTAMDRAELSEGSIHEPGALNEAAVKLGVVDLGGVERLLQAVGRATMGRVMERVLARRTRGARRRSAPRRASARWPRPTSRLPWARRGRGPAATASNATGVLAITVDGVRVPHRDGWHEIEVGVCAPLRPGVQVDAETGRAHPT